MHSTRPTQPARLQCAIPLQPQLLFRARRLAGNDADASDLVQDTFERALRSANAPAKVVELRPWLMRVLTNLWIDSVRAKAVRRTIPFCEETMSAPQGFSEPDPVTEDADSRELSLSEVTSALSKVPQPHQAALRMHVMDRKSYREIARELGVPSSTVGTRILRARCYLRRALDVPTDEEIFPARQNVA
jgi:RNA polymerase sigma-70 factor (ECF subfamily)